MVRQVLIILESPEEAEKCVEYFAKTASKDDDVVTLLKLGSSSSGGLVRDASIKAASALADAISATVAVMKSEGGMDALKRHKSQGEETCKGNCSNRNPAHVRKHHGYSPEIVQLFEDLQTTLLVNGSCVPPRNVNWHLLESESRTSHAIKSTLVEYLDNNKVDLVVAMHRGKEKGAAHELLVHAQIPALLVPFDIDEKIVNAYPERKLSVVPQDFDSEVLASIADELKLEPGSNNSPARKANTPKSDSSVPVQPLEVNIAPNVAGQDDISAL